MRKLIATALSLIIGAFGYTIVDKELSERVNDLEASVSSMQQEINSFRHLCENSTNDFEEDIYESTESSCSSSTTEPERIEMPCLIGMSSVEAESLLVSLGFKNIHFAYMSENLEDNYIYSQYPPAGYSYSTDISITLYLE